MLYALSPRRRALAAVFFLALLGLPGVLSAAAKRPIAETDLFKFVWIADPQISPDGRQAVFVRVTVNEKKEGYDTALWIVPMDGRAAPRWSPDGTRIVFSRAAEKEGKGRQAP